MYKYACKLFEHIYVHMTWKQNLKSQKNNRMYRNKIFRYKWYTYNNK